MIFILWLRDNCVAVVTDHFEALSGDQHVIVVLSWDELASEIINVQGVELF